MSNSVIVGAQWGDEGKAKIIDVLTKQSDIIVRFQGGANAGHTVIVDGTQYVFHLIPAGIIYPGKSCLIGNGVVVDLHQLLHEKNEIQDKGIDCANRLFISDSAHIVLPYHIATDKAQENSMGGNKIGTTGRGIGPAYADKVSRKGIRVGELRYWDQFTKKLKINFDSKKCYIEQILKQSFTLNFDEIVANFQSLRDEVVPMIIDSSCYLFEQIQQGKKVLFEGAQGTFLDNDHGTYPYVTSSNTLAGAVCTGAGVGPSMIDNVVGIVKTYTTRVGNGPFPTELSDSTGEHLQQRGGEFGATTGRPRRCGWFDAVMIRKSIQVNGITHFALTKLDVLDELDEIKVCVKYKIGDTISEQYPSDPLALSQAIPVYETLPGWKADSSKARSFEQLPANAQAYIQFLQKQCYNAPIHIVSVGRERNETFQITPLR